METMLFLLIMFVVVLLIAVVFLGVIIFANVNFIVKYNIDKDYLGLSHLSFHPLVFTPFVSRLENKLLGLSKTTTSPDPSVIRENYVFVGYKDYETKLSLFTPKNIEKDENAPCLVYYHGGGFLLDEAPFYYSLSCEYAKNAGIKVAFVHYRNAASHPFDCLYEDSYQSLEYIHKNASKLKIDPNRIAVGGDSAGGSIAAGITHMTKERGGPPICFQILLYPFLSEVFSAKAQSYVDVPILNYRAIAASRYTLHCEDNIKHFSPTYHPPADFVALPDAFIEVEEFCCLREGALAYADLLRAGGANVQVEDVQGTFHGYDIVKAPLTKKMFRIRIEALRKVFGL